MEMVKNSRLDCPLSENWVSLRLVDENGNGTSYAALAYRLVDCSGQGHQGFLDGDGYARVEGVSTGPVLLTVSEGYDGSDDLYYDLTKRGAYPLPITSLQVAAEQTRHRTTGEYWPSPYRAAKEKGEFYQVEVRDLVEHTTHLPPAAKLSIRPPRGAARLVRECAEGAPSYGVGLKPNTHHVLEVRALRALRPLLSTDPAFSPLNLYQLSLMATLSYGEFGQHPKVPETQDTLSYPKLGDVGHVLQERLAIMEEPRYYSDAKEPWYPLVEDVPYSKRLEIVPFDPALYKQNDPKLGEDQRTPEREHFYSDARDGVLDRKQTDTQAFATHDDRVVLISVRGTAGRWDVWRDVDAAQVPVNQGVGKAHQGFHDAYVSLRPFVEDYIRAFRRDNQKILVCGHSLGGAVALLLAEWLRRNISPDVILYTYGAPRAGDAAFVEGAKDLVHHRIVNHNDPVPSVPATWMETDKRLWIPGLAAPIAGAHPGIGATLFLAGLVRIGGEPYKHHGEQRHFMPVTLGPGGTAPILWKPGCEGIENSTEAACTYQALKSDMPTRKGLLGQLAAASEHSMLGGYVPSCWAALKRSQNAAENGKALLSTQESAWLKRELQVYRERLETWQTAARREFAAGRPESRPQDRPVLQQGSTYHSLQHRYRQIQSAIRDAQQELLRIETALQRLSYLATTTLSTRDIYGDAATHDELERIVARWVNHEEDRPVISAMSASRVAASV